MMGTCTVQGRTIGFERIGAGPPLVVINGYAATKADWDPTFTAALGEDRELIRIDNRGVGVSNDDGGQFTIEDLSADVAGVLAQLEIVRPPLLGWSMGGSVALALAIGRPDLVGKLVLLATTPGGDAGTRPAESAKARLLDLSGTPREQATRLISLLFTEDRAAEVDAEFGEIVASARAELSPETLQRQAAAMEEWQAGPGADLAAVSCPTLIATGSEDVVIPPANAVALATGIADAWLARFPGCGHGFMADHPKSLSRLIATFLSVRT